jgi:S-layer homology domain
MTQLRMGLGLLVAGGLLGVAGGAWGETSPNLLARAREVQVVAPSPTPRTFGPSSQTAHVIGASEFETINDTIGYSYILGHLRKSAGGSMFAWVRLPAGAVVESVELEGCDTNPAEQIGFALFRMASPNGAPEDVTTTGLTGDTPGCGLFSVTPFPVFSPLVIDNDSNTYFLQVTTGSMTGFTAVRVYYSLQVSPAPAVATFSDVPTDHPFFQFVEALVASGITVGCGGGLYCVNNPITRGEMAVFLSKALGLHFAP